MASWTQAPDGLSPGTAVAPYKTKARSEGILRIGPRVDYSRQRPTLPQPCGCSTIGGSRLNFRVRNGNGCDPAPVTTGELFLRSPDTVAQGLVLSEPASRASRRIWDALDSSADIAGVVEGRSVERPLTPGDETCVRCMTWAANLSKRDR